MNPIKIFFILVLIGPNASKAASHPSDLRLNQNQGQQSYFDQERQELICKEPIPIVRLSLKPDPTKKIAPSLCHCIWQSFPVNGWERSTASSIRLNLHIDLRIAEFIPRLGKAIKECRADTRI